MKQQKFPSYLIYLKIVSAMRRNLFPIRKKEIFLPFVVRKNSNRANASSPTTTDEKGF